MAAKLLGLTQSQVEERYDRIAAFADIGEFIEQPVKTYSSGMYVRLAFAVNAHVDADVLVIDEALAVGDAVFTQKCMRYIRGFRERGTLLFVSHDSAAVQSLCQSAVWLAQGRVRMNGSSRDVAEAYLKYVFQESYGDNVELKDVAAAPAPNESAPSPDTPQPTVTARERRVGVAGSNLDRAQGFRTGNSDIVDVGIEVIGEEPRQVFRGGEQVRLRIRAVAHERIEQPIIGFLLRDRLGQELFGDNTARSGAQLPAPVEPGQQFEACFLFTLPLLPNGDYALTTSVAGGDLLDNVHHNWLHDALIIHISSSAVRYGLVGIPFDDVRMRLCN